MAVVHEVRFISGIESTYLGENGPGVLNASYPAVVATAQSKKREIAAEVFAELNEQHEAIEKEEFPDSSKPYDEREALEKTRALLKSPEVIELIFGSIISEYTASSRETKLPLPATL